jgi:hypothetical protein
VDEWTSERDISSTHQPLHNTLLLPKLANDGLFRRKTDQIDDNAIENRFIKRVFAVNLTEEMRKQVEM